MAGKNARCARIDPIVEALQWSAGTCGDRVSAVLHMDARDRHQQQTLYDIAFCDYVKIVRIAAVYKLNHLCESEYRPIRGYILREREVRHGYIGAHGDCYFSPGYGGGFPDRRASVIPYITSSTLLQTIALHDESDAVVTRAAAMLEEPADLEEVVENARCSEAGKETLKLFLAERRSGKPAILPRLLAEPDREDKSYPSPYAPDFGELQLIVTRLYGIPPGEEASIGYRDIQAAVTAVVELEDFEFADYLRELYRRPGFPYRDLLERYEGAVIIPKMIRDEYGNSWNGTRFLL